MQRAVLSHRRLMGSSPNYRMGSIMKVRRMSLMVQRYSNHMACSVPRMLCVNYSSDGANGYFLLRNHYSKYAI